LNPVLRLAVHHDRSVKRFSLPLAEAVLGASTSCDLVVPFPGVSRRHATVRPLDGGLLISDLGSKNGLVKDGTRITEILLRPRDRVRLCRAWLELEEIASSDAAIGLSLGIPTASTVRSESNETGQLTDLPGSGSPASVLAVIRAVESAGGIDPAQPDGARALLDLARLALEASSLWVWSDQGEDLPSIRALAGPLPSEDLLRILATAARIQAEQAGPGHLVILPGGLASPLRDRVTGLAATLQHGASRVAVWRLDLFDYLVAKVTAARVSQRPRARTNPATLELVRFPEEFVRGESEAMQKLVEALATAAQSRLDVLLLGETGTGKELVAKAIHMSGPTSAGPFVAINCAAIPAELLEAQLFGVEARVATGVDPRPGLFLKADGGSLFLDEIGDLPEPLQAKLLRAIQEREILPLGATRPRKIDVRVISASNKELGELTRQGKFRADLYYRLRGLQFHMPPLRERREDLPALTLSFAQRGSKEYGKSIQGISRKALSVLSVYDWPGNIRELKSEVERAVLLCPDGGVLETEHFAPVLWAVERARQSADSTRDEIGTATSSGPFSCAELPSETVFQSQTIGLRLRLDELERLEIGRALTAAHGNKSKAAADLGITRNGLALKMKRLGISG
jgi:DNA-binding NtrC family response regulator